MRLLVSCLSCDLLRDHNVEPRTESQLRKQYKRLFDRGGHARVILDKEDAIPAGCRCEIAPAAGAPIPPL